MGLTSVLLLVGLALTVTGAALIYVPAAFIVAGAGLAGLSVLGPEVER